MSLSFYKLNDDFSIVDNMDSGVAGLLDKRRRFTSPSVLYGIHILAGTCLLDINGYEVDLKKRDFLVLIQGSLIHVLSCSEDLKFCCIVVKRSVARRLFDEVGFNLTVPERIHKFYKTECPEDYHDSKLKDYLHLKSRIASGTVFGRCMARRIVETILLKDMELYGTDRPQALQRLGRKEQTFYDFMKLLEKYYQRERCLSFYADTLGLTAKYLSAVIKEVSGKQFTYWIDEPVVAEAKKMLCCTNKSIRQISDELGFVDQSKFGRFFKNITGKSPRQFRNTEE